MPFAIGDEVQTSAALADEGPPEGWTGFLTETYPGPQEPGWRVTRRYGESRECGDLVVSPQEIVAGPIAQPPVPILGARVALAGEAGEIVAVGPGDAYTVAVLVPLTRRRGRDYKGKVEYLRYHTVPAWRLA